ncbi:hypothetical protein RMCBS344292_00196 [Rhizopus microsporus]|nr:hypothetical protein RMCBS344292_00196 [Rhizopus microsporus]
MLPSSLLHFTNRQKNRYPSYINTFEDTLRALSLLLPGHFQDSDLCSQTILTGLNLISLVHTKVLVEKHLSTQIVDGSFNARFIQNYQTKRLCRLASWTLSIISYTEVVAEMFLSRRVSRMSRWKWITSIEGIKFLLRLALFYGAKRKMILHPTHYIRNVDPDTLDLQHKDDKLELSHLDPRTGTALSKESDTKSQSRSGWSHMGELLWMVRPLVYALMILVEQRKMSVRSDPKEVQEDEEEQTEKDEESLSWKPWLASLCIDWISLIAANMQTSNRLEKEELKRRSYLLLYYFLRGPMYTQVTRVLLDRFCDATEHRPIVSIVTAALNDYRPFWQDSYFYTSGS